MTTQYDLAGERIWQAAQPYAAYLADPDAVGDGYDEDEAFKDAVMAELETLAAPLGMIVSPVYEAASMYWDIELVDDEGFMLDRVRVRASNHTQRNGGTAWSFEAQNAAVEHACGLIHVARKIKEMRSA